MPKLAKAAMPIQTEFLQDGRVIVIRASGALSVADYAEFAPQIEDSVQEYGKIRIVFVMTDFHGWELSAVWEDIKFDAKHYRNIERLALVGDRAWERGMAAFCLPFTTADIRYFDIADEADAATWAQEANVAAPTDAATVPVQLDRLSAVRVFVFDLEAARRFYTNTLGLSELSIGDDFATFALQEARLVVELVHRTSDYALLVGRFSGISLAVDDIHVAFDALQARGVNFLDPPEEQPWGGTIAHFEDADENILTIVQNPAS